MQNILYSATRQWNPGDEFILMGAEYLMTQILGSHNSILYNRNPQIRPDFSSLRENKFARSLLKKLYKKLIDNRGFLDNSFKPNRQNSYVDMVVFAGSPEWYGRRLEELYKFIDDKNTPVIFLGLGAADTITLNKFSKVELSVLDKSKLLTCREEYCTQVLESFNSIYLPCPALFSSPIVKRIEKVKKIALLYGTNKAVDANNISKETDLFMKEIYQSLLGKYSDEYEFEFVAHYIDELDQFEIDYPNRVLRYHYKSDAYIDIFKEYDLVIGHRVHGIGMCASMGIPGIMIAHDKRSATVQGFLAEMVYTNSDYSVFEEIFRKTVENIALKNQQLLEHKEDTKNTYLSLLKKALL